MSYRQNSVQEFGFLQEMSEGPKEKKRKMRLGGVIDIWGYVASLSPLSYRHRKTYGVTPNAGLLNSGLLVYLLLLPHCRKPETCVLIDTLGAWKAEYLYPATGPEPLITVLPILLPPLPRIPGGTPYLLPLLH